ncbi:MAG: protein adenylyltransferase SelO family protein, partial [Nitrospiria bacterium]
MTPAVLHHTDSLPFGHSFATLPPEFFTRLMPTPLPSPYLVAASAAAAELIGLDPAEFGTTNFVESFSGNRIPHGAMPIAAVYSGHQFGVWAGQLGDGRAILLGDVPVAGMGPPGSL